MPPRKAQVARQGPYTDIKEIPRRLRRELQEHADDEADLLALANMNQKDREGVILERQERRAAQDQAAAGGFAGAGTGLDEILVDVMAQEPSSEGERGPDLVDERSEEETESGKTVEEPELLGGAAEIRSVIVTPGFLLDNCTQWFYEEVVLNHCLLLLHEGALHAFQKWRDETRMAGDPDAGAREFNFERMWSELERTQERTQDPPLYIPVRVLPRIYTKNADDAESFFLDTYEHTRSLYQDRQAHSESGAADIFYVDVLTPRLSEERGEYSGQMLTGGERMLGAGDRDDDIDGFHANQQDRFGYGDAGLGHHYDSPGMGNDGMGGFDDMGGIGGLGGLEEAGEDFHAQGSRAGFTTLCKLPLSLFEWKRRQFGEDVHPWQLFDYDAYVELERSKYWPEYQDGSYVYEISSKFKCPDRLPLYDPQAKAQPEIAAGEGTVAATAENFFTTDHLELSHEILVALNAPVCAFGEGMRSDPLPCLIRLQSYILSALPVERYEKMNQMKLRIDALVSMETKALLQERKVTRDEIRILPPQELERKFSARTQKNLAVLRSEFKAASDLYSQYLEQQTATVGVGAWQGGRGTGSYLGKRSVLDMDTNFMGEQYPYAVGLRSFIQQLSPELAQHPGGEGEAEAEGGLARLYTLRPGTPVRLADRMIVSLDGEALQAPLPVAGKRYRVDVVQDPKGEELTAGGEMEVRDIIQLRAITVIKVVRRG